MNLNLRMQVMHVMMPNQITTELFSRQKKTLLQIQFIKLLQILCSPSLLKIADLRTHIDAQFLNLRKHISMVSSTTVQSIPAQIADLRTHIDNQFLSLRQHVGKASSSNTMQSIPAQIIDLRTHIDDQFLNVRQHISMVSSNTVQSIPAQIADLRIPIDEQFLNLKQHIGTYF